MALPLPPDLVFGISQLVFSGALVYVTYRYYLETGEQTAEMQRTREAEFQPIIKPTIDIDPGQAIFAFENIGKGAARNVSATWGFKSHNHEVSWEHPLVSPEERFQFYLPTPGEKRVVSKNDIKETVDGDVVLYFRVSYDDPLGESYNPEPMEIDVLQVLEGHTETGGVWKNSKEEELVDAVSSIEESLRRVKQSVEGGEIGDVTKMQKWERLRDIIRKEEKLSVSELHEKSGVGATEALFLMSQSGEIELVSQDGERGHPQDPDTTIHWTRDSNSSD